MPLLSKIPVSTDYPKLLRSIKKEIAQGQLAVRKQQALTYWKVGRLISRQLLRNKERAEYGVQLFKKLVQDLGVDKNTLHQSVGFYRKFPIVSARVQLDWTHYRELISVEDKSLRRKLENKATRQKLTTRQLKEEINKEKPVTIIVPQVYKFPVQRGQLYTYKIVKSPAGSVQPIEGYVIVDCGFSAMKLHPQGSASLKPGDIVQSIKKDSYYELRASTASPKDLYTFKAYLERIVDGDTIWVTVDLGFYMILHQKLRFRHINVPELSTSQGRKAKKFIESRLKPLDFVVIKTYSSDKYDRYLVDVFYLAGEKDESVVAKQGTLLNKELIEEGLAEVWRS